MFQDWPVGARIGGISCIVLVCVLVGPVVAIGCYRLLREAVLRVKEAVERLERKLDKLTGPDVKEARRILNEAVERGEDGVDADSPSSHTDIGRDGLNG